MAGLLKPRKLDRFQKQMKFEGGVIKTSSGAVIKIRKYVKIQKRIKSTGFELVRCSKYMERVLGITPVITQGSAGPELRCIGGKGGIQ